ncbi:hypothetical protein AC3_1399 [Clostridium perfringens E str. JGS1987]|uniref:ParB/Sulfiredoxin domain-containing protein n=1 Tax=Clostridium perfringens E str. JGS1987 TaxID=451755 RepID=B1BUD0_CLOPF|nr:hypothetical protein AC3_1399 [Clostridium perfringens E str. JGS1987]
MPQDLMIVSGHQRVRACEEIRLQGYSLPLAPLVMERSTKLKI